MGVELNSWSHNLATQYNAGAEGEKAVRDIVKHLKSDDKKTLVALVNGKNVDAVKMNALQKAADEIFEKQKAGKLDKPPSPLKTRIAKGFQNAVHTLTMGKFGRLSTDKALQQFPKAAGGKTPAPPKAEEKAPPATPQKEAPQRPEGQRAEVKTGPRPKSWAGRETKTSLAKEERKSWTKTSGEPTGQKISRPEPRVFKRPAERLPDIQLQDPDALVTEHTETHETLKFENVTTPKQVKPKHPKKEYSQLAREIAASPDDEAVVMRVITKDGFHIRNASENLRNKPSVMLTALKTAPGMIANRGPDLKNDIAFLKNAIQTNPDVFQHLTSDLRNNVELQQAFEERTKA